METAPSLVDPILVDGMDGIEDGKCTAGDPTTTPMPKCTGRTAPGLDAQNWEQQQKHKICRSSLATKN